jgi:hypothetical protein
MEASSSNPFAVSDPLSTQKITRGAKTKNPARSGVLRAFRPVRTGGSWARGAAYARLSSAAERSATLARALRPFLRFVDAQGATIHLKPVQGLNGGLRFTLRHVDETEATGLSSFPVIDEFDRVDFAVTLEEASDVLLCGVEGEIPYVDRRHPITRLQKADSGEPHETVA